MSRKNLWDLLPLFKKDELRNLAKLLGITRGKTKDDTIWYLIDSKEKLAGIRIGMKFYDSQGSIEWEY